MKKVLIICLFMIVFLVGCGGPTPPDGPVIDELKVSEVSDSIDILYASLPEIEYSDEKVQAEIERILFLVKNNINKGKTIGILSPFRAQVTAIEKAIIDNYSYEEIKANKITVGTAHSFQGDEKDIMIISWVIADNSPYQSQTFVNNDNLFNVAITRGKEQVINLYSTNNLKDTLLKKYLDSII